MPDAVVWGADWVRTCCWLGMDPCAHWCRHAAGPHHVVPPRPLFPQVRCGQRVHQGKCEEGSPWGLGVPACPALHAPPDREHLQQQQQEHCSAEQWSKHRPHAGNWRGSSTRSSKQATREAGSQHAWARWGLEHIQAVRELVSTVVSRTSSR